MDDCELLTPTEAAAKLKIQPATLKVWRSKKRGPRVVWLAPNVPRYRPADLVQFAVERTRDPAGGGTKAGVLA